VKRWKARLKPAKKRPTAPCAGPWAGAAASSSPAAAWGRSSEAHRAGVRLRAISTLSTIDETMVIENWR
jgi:hypothetical protein